MFRFHYVSYGARHYIGMGDGFASDGDEAVGDGGGGLAVVMEEDFLISLCALWRKRDVHINSAGRAL